jgi:porphobilinogen synthase
VTISPGLAAGGFPVRRPRRSRASAALRDLVAEVRLHPADLVLPMFVREGLAEPRAIESLPAVVQHSRASLVAAAKEAVAAGVGGIMVFGVPAHRDPTGSGADRADGVLNVALADLADALGDQTVLMADLCLDEFTDHGHCGVLDTAGRVDNDATLDRYRAMALAQAAAGVHVIGTSGMMDGQVAAVRSALDGAGRDDVAVLAYAAKYASAFYGPFRDAVESTLTGDRTTYQLDPRNGREALLEVGLDLAEGADLVMVKPALPYLDVVRRVADASPVPVAAYQVSGEYAMIAAAGARGWVDVDRAMLEALVSIRRAGAEIVLTYAASGVARRLQDGGR